LSACLAMLVFTWGLAFGVDAVLKNLLGKLDDFSTSLLTHLRIKRSTHNLKIHCDVHNGRERSRCDRRSHIWVLDALGAAFSLAH
jgi:hypothetical protein